LSAEKKALIRFLIIYIVSTLFIASIGEYFYYKIAKTKIIENEISKVKTDIFHKLQYRRFWDNNLTIFRNQIRIKGELPYIQNEYEIKNKKIFYKLTEYKRWGKLEIIDSMPFDFKKVINLRKDLFFFNIFLLIFITFVAFLLSKVFLAPMKNQIKNLEEFIRDTTHEINTPISIIKSNIEMLELKGVSTKEYKRIKSATIRINQIFENLKHLYLNHTKSKANLNIKELINHRLNFFESEIEKKHLTIQKKLEDVYVEIAKEDILRIIDNLLINAIKYSPKNDEIIIKLNKNNLEIKNRGNIKNPKNITQKYVREKDGGFGLGLYIVDKVCKENNLKFTITAKDNFVSAKVYF